MNTDRQNSGSPSLAKLFISFLKLGGAAFGGPAMITYIRKMVVEQKNWLDDATFRNGVAFCQMVPGATAMQMTAYVGLKLRGVAGAFACFTGFGLPAFVIMMILTFLYQQFQGIQITTSIFNGLQTIVIAIIAYAALSFGRTSIKNWESVLIAIVAAILFGFGVNPFPVILFCGGLGLLLFWKHQYPSVKSTPKTISTLKPVLIILSTIIVLSVILFFINRNLFDMATLMFRIDLFAFGGGFASVPLMFNEVVNVNSWMDGKTLMDGIALGQITPGPIVITATFIGYIMSGSLGALISTIFVFSPSFLIVTGISPYFDKFRNSPYFTKIINGILSSFVGLLISTTILFALKIHWDVLHIIIAATAFTALWFKIEIYWIVLVGILISIFIL